LKHKLKEIIVSPGLKQTCRCTDTEVQYSFYLNSSGTSTPTAISTSYARFIYYNTLSYGMLRYIFLARTFLVLNFHRNESMSIYHISALLDFHNYQLTLKSSEQINGVS
jgi:hypothetical protein